MKKFAFILIALLAVSQPVFAKGIVITSPVVTRPVAKPPIVVVAPKPACPRGVACY